MRMRDGEGEDDGSLPPVLVVGTDDLTAQSFVDAQVRVARFRCAQDALKETQRIAPVSGVVARLEDRRAGLLLLALRRRAWAPALLVAAPSSPREALLARATALMAVPAVVPLSEEAVRQFVASCRAAHVVRAGLSPKEAVERALALIRSVLGVTEMQARIIREHLSGASAGQAQAALEIAEGTYETHVSRLLALGDDGSVAEVVQTVLTVAMRIMHGKEDEARREIEEIRDARRKASRLGTRR